MPENRHDRTTPARALSRDVTVQLSGVEARVATGRVAIGTETVRRDINRLCKFTYTRALAWCLYVHAKDPKKPVPDLFEWLDEIGAMSPGKRNADNVSSGKSGANEKRNEDWNEYYHRLRRKSEQLVSKHRMLLRKNGIPCNA